MIGRKKRKQSKRKNRAKNHDQIVNIHFLEWEFEISLKLLLDFTLLFLGQGVMIEQPKIIIK
jgi:hypothetical protein